jgi:hypothetical protein
MIGEKTIWGIFHLYVCKDLQRDSALCLFYFLNGKLAVSNRVGLSLEMSAIFFLLFANL